MEHFFGVVSERKGLLLDIFSILAGGLTKFLSNAREKIPRLAFCMLKALPEMSQPFSRSTFSGSILFALILFRALLSA